MMRFAGVALLLACNSLHAAEPPLELFTKEEFNAVTFARAVNHFVDIGETTAIPELLALSSDAKPDVETKSRVSWVLRVLYLARTQVPLRRPMYGALVAPAPEMAFAGWQLFPLVRSGDSYFVLSDTYLLAGLAEDPRDYLDYCRQNGAFRKERVPVPLRTRALKDAAALRSSPEWRAIKWSAQGEFLSYSASEELVWRFVSGQAETIDSVAE